jgi:hypothetical protein
VRGNSSDFMARNNYDLNGKEAHIADVLTRLYNTLWTWRRFLQMYRKKCCLPLLQPNV